MSDVQQAAVQFEVMPGWHPDPGNAAQVRWWDGTAWTTHVAPNPPAIPTPAGPPQVEQPRIDPMQEQLQREAAYVPFAQGFGGESYQAYQASQFQASQSAQTFPVWLLAFSSIWAGAIIDFGALAPLYHLPGYFFAVAALVAYGTILALAWADSTRLRNRGFDRIASPAWAFLGPLGYLIARVVYLKRRSVAPLVVYFSPVVLGIISAILIPIFIAVARAGN